MDIAGHKINNWWIVGGGAGAVVVYYVYRNASNKSAAASSTASDSSEIDPVTGLPYSEDDEVDPLTGMEYLTEAQEYGSVQAAEEAVSENGTSEEDLASDEGDVYPEDYSSDSTSTGQTYTTNAQWAQAVTSGLTSLGYSATSISAALGLYFAGSAESAADVSIVQAALAEYGPPPEGTYNIIPEPNTGSSPGSGSTGSTVTVPSVTGERVEDANAALKAAGLTSTLSETRAAGVAYYVNSQTPAAGASVASGSNVDLGITTTKPGGSTGTTPPHVVAKPAAPTLLAIAYSNSGTITASWKAVSGAASYNFGISPAPRDGSAASHNIGSRTSYDVGDLVKGKTYKVTVSATNSAGTGPSATKSFKAK